MWQAAAAAAAAQAALLVHTASTSTTQLLLLYVCSLGPSRSSTLLSILPYIAYSKQQQTNLAASYSTITAVAGCCKVRTYTRHKVVCTPGTIWYLPGTCTRTAVYWISTCVPGTHYIQQHCCNVLFIVVFIHPGMVPGNTYVEYIYLHTVSYTHVYGCARVSHVRALVFDCIIQIQPGWALVQEKHAWKN